MRMRVAALIALAGVVAIPAVSGAAPGRGRRALRVDVEPRFGTIRTHFVISFRTPEATGRLGSVRRSYRITAGDRRRGRCQSSATSVLPPSTAAMLVRVTLSPRRAARWCIGTFRGQVWAVLTEPCPRGKACPAYLPLPRMVGRFTFHVTRR